MKKYKGIDPSATWKVVTNEGKTITFVTETGKVKELTGFNGYRFAAEYTVVHGGTPVRE